MITTDQKQMILSLHREGRAVQYTSNLIGVSRQTIYRYLKKPENSVSTLTQGNIISKKLLSYQENINLMLRKGIVNYKTIYQAIKTEGYQGSYATLQRFLMLTKRENLLKKYKTSIRYETQPGEEAQVDWGTFGKITVNDIKTQLYCFVYVLGWSRMMYIEFTIKQNLQTLQECHIHAFKELGIPKTILYDNMKTVIINRENNSNSPIRINLNKGFSDFAQYYGFEIKLAHPYWPRSKGKVEAGVKYVRYNFIQGLKYKKKFLSLGELNEKAKVWLNTVVNVREHKGIQEKRPLDLWKKEKNYLHFPDIPSYKTAPFVIRNSTKDQLIHYKRNFYSVPKEYSRRKLFVREFNNNGIISIEIYFKDILVTTHNLVSGRGNLIFEDKHHVSKLENISTKNIIIKRKRTNNKNNNLPRMMIRPLSYYNQLIQK